MSLLTNKIKKVKFSR